MRARTLVALRWRFALTAAMTAGAWLASPAREAHAASDSRATAPSTRTSAPPAKPAVTPGQDLHYRVWTVEDGLPNGSVRDVAQTPDDYLWIATLDGLVRFDGVRMQVFSRSEIPEMGSNRCLRLYVGQAGTLWVGTEEGTVLQITNGRLRSFGAASGLPEGEIDLHAEDPRGRMWVYVRSTEPRWFNGERWVAATAEHCYPRVRCGLASGRPEQPPRRTHRRSHGAR